MMSRHSWQRVRSRKEASQQRRDEQAAAARRDRAAKKAGVLGLTAAQIILREQLAAKIAADTAVALARLKSGEPTPPPEPPPGPFTLQFKEKLT